MPNPDRYRCPECRTRRTDPHSLILHMLRCTRPLCHCLAYTYPHRPMGGACFQNPEAQMARALKSAGPQDDLLDLVAGVALAVPGKPMRAWPFDKNGVFANA